MGRGHAKSTQVLEHSDAVADVTITPDGKYIVSSSKDGNLYIWDARKRRPVKQIGGHQSSINAVAVTSDGNRMITG